MTTESTTTTAPLTSHPGESTSEAVVAAVADAKSVSPLGLRPVARAIDPDALDALFDENPIDGSVEFSYEGYRVEVDATTGITVDELSD